MCTVLPLVLQQRTSETCTDLVQWNCFSPHKHKCSLYNFHCLLRDTPRVIQRGLARWECFGHTEAEKWEAKWKFLMQFSFLSTDLKLLRKINEILIINCEFLNLTISARGVHCYCSSRTSINPAIPLNIPRNSVNINTNKILSMQKQLHLTTDQIVANLQGQIFITYIVCRNIKAILTLCNNCRLCLVPATQYNSRTLQTAVCVVRRLLGSTES